MDKFVEDLSGDTKRKSTGIYRNLQESTGIYLVSKNTLSFSNLLVVANKRKF